MIFFIAIGLSVSGNLLAQKDTVQLSPVIVRGFAAEHFMSGLKVQKIDSAALLTFRFQNISDLLSFNTPIAFKNYGPGQLNTASFRGTSANHTAVLWNGLNINSPTLGQTDFSTIPVAGFDKLSVQYGSAASVVGTDAVGGSILLGSSAGRTGLGVSLGASHENFDNTQIQLGVGYGLKLANNRSFSTKTSYYNGRMGNHFPYTERRGYYVLSAESFQKGLIQDVFFKPKSNQQLSAHIWLTGNDLTTTPENLAGRERTHTISYRTMLRYELGDWVFRTSWVRDVLDYATGDYSNLDHALTDKFTTRAEKNFQYNFGRSGAYVAILAGGEWSTYRTRVAGYADPLITENRGDIFALTRLQATPRWLISVNLRQAFVTGFNPPLTPSLGTEFQLFKNRFYGLKFRGSVSRSYRVPTLNERYWKALGNRDIRPEYGFNKEAGFDGNYNLNNGHSLTGSVTAYHNRIHDWTYWNPAKNYHVENLQEVLARGLETQLGWNYHTGHWNTGLKLSYALNKSSQEKAYDAYSKDVIGKQLVYVPLHSGNFNGFLSYKKSKISVQMLGLSKRYNTFDNSSALDGYPLINFLAETAIDVGEFWMRVQGQVNNLSDTFYLNVRNNAMPGRSFAVNLLFGYKGPDF